MNELNYQHERLHYACDVIISGTDAKADCLVHTDFISVLWLAGPMLIEHPISDTLNTFWIQTSWSSEDPKTFPLCDFDWNVLFITKWVFMKSGTNILVHNNFAQKVQ